jgi:hypothetical protein
MSNTSDAYKEYILENIIKGILDSGQIPTTELIDSMYYSFINEKDFSQPLFDNNTANVQALENASASKYNKTNFEIHRDLQIAYSSMFDSTNKTISNLDRWRTESAALKAKLLNLDSRISNLLNSQLKPNVYYVSDSFQDVTKIDTTQTSALISLKSNNITLHDSSDTATRVNLNYIDSANIIFTILSRTGLQNVTDAPGTKLINILDDKDTFWQSRIYMSNSANPVSAELRFKISDTPITISKITCNLHVSNTSSGVQLTPFVSTDGINYSQLNINNITISTTSNATWSFPSTEVTDVKFIMTKQGFDHYENGQYIYEFGFQEIALYNAGFGINAQEIFVSKPLSVTDINNKPVSFIAGSLEVCDDIPANTNIQYYIAALINDTDTPTWNPIDPINSKVAIYPNTINFGENIPVALKNVKLSYDAMQDVGFINPAKDFYVSSITPANPTNTLISAQATRYVTFNSNDRILDHEINGDLNLIDSSIVVFRNVGSKGDKTKVRNIQRGWTFEDPYYSAAIRINNINGIYINFGQQDILLDGKFVNGGINIPAGIHQIKINKNNWLDMPAGLTIDQLRSKDLLYPFNHKLLIEGYSLNNQQNPYLGVDLFAGILMKKVSLSSFIHSIDKDDYTRFALDKDAIIPNKATPSTIFMVKCNENSSDSLDEIFNIEFNIKNQFFNFIQLKAILSTDESSVAPILQNYIIKLST